MSEALDPRAIEAATFFNKAARQALATDGKLHAETLILSTARMAGSLMYRSFGFDSAIEPGTGVLSDLANERGPRLMSMMLVTLQSQGHQITEQDLNPAYASARYSPMSFRESHERLAPHFLRHCEQAQVPFGMAAVAAAVATGVIVHDCAAALPVRNGAALAVYGLVEGTKTAPFPVLAAGRPNATVTRRAASKPDKPWYKFW